MRFARNSPAGKRRRCITRRSSAGIKRTLGERGASAPWFAPINDYVLFIHMTRGLTPSARQFACRLLQKSATACTKSRREEGSPGDGFSGILLDCPGFPFQMGRFPQFAHVGTDLALHSGECSALLLTSERGSTHHRDVNHPPQTPSTPREQPAGRSRAGVPSPDR